MIVLKAGGLSSNQYHPVSCNEDEDEDDANGEKSMEGSTAAYIKLCTIN